VFTGIRNTTIKDRSVQRLASRRSGSQFGVHGSPFGDLPLPGFYAAPDFKRIFSHSVPTVSSVRAFPPLIIRQIKPSRSEAGANRCIATIPRQVKNHRTEVAEVCGPPFGVGPLIAWTANGKDLHKSSRPDFAPQKVISKRLTPQPGPLFGTENRTWWRKPASPIPIDR
jgi:hypothetical protein